MKQANSEIKVYDKYSEFKKDFNYVNTMHRCNASIGNAIYYSQITIVIGYSFLMLSQFIPTILFGFLSALAMAASLVGSLTLLPALIILFKPFGPEASPAGPKAIEDAA